MRSDTPSPLWGLPFLAAGLGVLGIGLGVFPVDPSTVHAPLWVLALCGIVFVMGGIAVLGYRWPRVRSAAAGTLVLAMGLVGGWVALFGEAAQFSGGLPFVPASVNVAIARVIFGMGSLMCLAIFAWGTVQTVRGEAE